MDPTGFAVGSAVASAILWSLDLSSIFPHGQQVWIEWMAWAVVLGACKLRSFYWHKVWTAARRTPASSTSTSTSAASSPLAQIDEETCIPSMPGQNGSSKLSSTSTSMTLVTILLLISQFVASFAGIVGVRWAFPLVSLFILLASILRRRGSRAFSSSNTCGMVFSPSEVITAATCIGSSLGLIFWGLKFEYRVFGAGFIYAALTTTSYYFLADTVSHEELSSPSSSCCHQDTDQSCFSRLFDTLDAMSVRAFGMCTLCLALISTPIPRLDGLILVVVMLRICQLFSIITLCSANFPFVAASMATAASVMSEDLLTLAPFAGTVKLAIAIAALVQAYCSVPKIRSNRLLLFALLLVPLLRIILPTATTSSVDSGPSIIVLPPPPMGSVHPIQQLVETNRQYFRDKLSSQSQTVGAAAKEYIRRYGRPPPPGFGKWFEVAKSKDFLFIDELDTVMQSLEPFWGVSPASLRARVKSVQRADRVISVSVGADAVSQSEDHPLTDDLKRWLNREVWGEALPEVNFIISLLDEPRVVVPDDTLDLAMRRAQGQETTSSKWKSGGGGSAQANNVEWMSIGTQHAWEAMVSSCHIDDPARDDTIVVKKNLYPFVSNVTAEMDVCASSDLLNSHGFLASPQSLVVTHSLVPIFSQCKPSIFNDILYPSPYYQGQIMSGDYSEDEDPPWEDKLDRLYWAGASTGGFATEENWMRLHRQRLVRKTAADNRESVQLLERDVKGNWQPRVSDWSSLANLFYTRLTAVIQSDEAAFLAQQDVFNAPPELKSAALGSKYLLDMDGNSFSGRYYRLLKSKSAVLKYTIFKEWHDDRLIPWVHYIPISNSADELGEIMRFLVDEPEGRKMGATIAEESRDWTRRTLRTEDLEIVFIRVLMEYARIIDDNRDTMNFEIGHY